MRVGLLTLSLALTVLLGGCVTQSQMQNLDAMWDKDNQQVFKKLGTRDFQGVTKEQAMSALAITFQNLDLITTSSDYRAGTMTALAKAPKPLTFDEFKIVEEVEAPRSRSLAPFIGWNNLVYFESVFNAVALETKGGVQISIRGNLKFTGSTLQIIPVTQFPPKGLEIALRKFWDEYDKNVFVQKKTLAN